MEVLTEKRLAEAKDTVRLYFQKEIGEIEKQVNRAACELAAAKYYSFPKDRLEKFKEALEWKGDAGIQDSPKKARAVANFVHRKLLGTDSSQISGDRAYNSNTPIAIGFRTAVKAWLRKEFLLLPAADSDMTA